MKYANREFCCQQAEVASSLRAIRFTALILIMTAVMLSSLDLLAQTSAPAQDRLQQPQQSLLFVVSDQGLKLVRREHLGVPTIAPVKQEESYTASVFPTESASPAVGDAYVEWLDADGQTLLKSAINDPRLLRAPGQGARIHSGTALQVDAYFLVRGPAKAQVVNVHLPALEELVVFSTQASTQGSVANQSAAANPVQFTGAKAGFAEQSRTSEQLNKSSVRPLLIRQTWRVEL